MGEIIERPSPEKPLEFNGERLTSTFKGQTAIEHWHRYLVARELVRGQDVLDVASGEGYGSALLAQTAKSVVGVDVSAEAVAHAQTSYLRSNLRYLEGDALNLPLQTASVDAVVSFETLEHFFDHDRFFTQIKRILRPNGFLLISTPDRDNYMASSAPPNPFHKLELTMHEFLMLLQRHFSVVSCQGQRVLLGAAMVATEGNAQPTLCFERRGTSHFESSVGMSRGRYLVALASNNIELRMPESIFIDSDQLFNFDGEELERYHTTIKSRETELANLQQENAQLKPLVDNLRSELSLVQDAQGADHKERAKLHLVIDELRAEVAMAQQENAKLQQVNDQRQQENAQLRQENAKLQQESAELQQVNAQLKLFLDKTRSESVLARQAQGTAQEKNAKLRSALDTIENQLTKARQDYLLLQSVLDEQVSRFVSAQEENAALQLRLVQREEAYAILSRERDHLSHLVAAIFASTSWKLSAPVRMAGKLLGRR
jgi:SAM-dependent methyltransferase